MTVTDLTPLATTATTEQIHSFEPTNTSSKNMASTDEPNMAGAVHDDDAVKSNADDEEPPCSPLAIATEASSSSSCSSSQAEDNGEISMTQEISMCGEEEGERKRSVSDKDDLSETQDDDAGEPEAKKAKSPSLAVTSDSVADAAGGGEEVAEDVVCASSKTDDDNAGGHDDDHDVLPEQQQNCSNQEEEKEEDKKAEDHSATIGVEVDQVEVSLEVQHDPAVEEKIDVPEDHDATPPVEEVTAA